MGLGDGVIIIFNNRSGHIVVLLPVVVLLFIIMVCMVNFAQTVFSGDVVLKNSVVIATKAAANFLGNYDSADGVFEQMLKENLKLQTDLEASSNSIFTGKPNYTLILYKGNSINDQPAGMIYKFDHGTCDKIPIMRSGFPQTFLITGAVTATLDSPGAISDIEFTSNKVFGGQDCYLRMAIAKPSLTS